ncbi:MAG: hypothetical protein L0241_00225 [Planctomycetia bacterium]|nr:hypothetical protein [Planctomycetia bacterium]
MSNDTQPTPSVEPATTGADTSTNGAPANGVDPRPDLPRWEEGPDKLPLTIWWREYIRDLRWIEEQFRLGAWEQFAGNYIAVWDKRLIDYGPDLLALRERLKHMSGINPAHVAVTYVEPPIEG